MLKISNSLVSYQNINLNIRLDYKQIILLSLLLLSLFTDHITTHIGISNGLHEINSNVIFLINNNLWLITDLFITFALFATPIFLSSFFEDNYIRVFYLFPVITVVIRLFVCLNNISLLLSL
jgi:hypothetical protein